jgi:hypothetical protein|tara:strand:- start:157 stop:336 length:180 start_codon:yes stop_codon:yes gene_type:complete
LRRRLHAYIDHPSVKRPDDQTTFCDAPSRTSASGGKKKKKKKRRAAGGKKKKEKKKQRR